MHQIIKKTALPVALSLNLILAACGGGGGASGKGGTNVPAGDTVSINGTTYSTNSSTVRVSGAVNQTSQFGYKLGGPAAIISMGDTQSGNSLNLQVLSTVDGWPGTYTVMDPTYDTTAYITDKSVATGGSMRAYQYGTGTGGTVTFKSFGSIGQPITGSFNINLCDSNAACPASLKNYTGNFSINRTENYGSLARPVNVMIATSTPVTYAFGIHPTTGKNYFTIPTNATGGTLNLTLTPTVDVNMAIYTDAGFTTPATCNVTSTLNVVGNGAETCSISVTANQKIYVTVSQPASATGRETFTLAMSE